MNRSLLVGSVFSLLTLLGCERDRGDRAVPAELDRAMNAPTYSFPQVEPALRKSLDLRTFRIPSAMRDGEQSLWIQAKVGEEVFLGQTLDLSDGRSFVTLCRSARGNELLYSSHSETDGFSGVLPLGETAIHDWTFYDPDPTLVDGRLVLARAGDAEVFLGIRSLPPTEPTLESER